MPCVEVKPTIYLAICNEKYETVQFVLPGVQTGCFYHTNWAPENSPSHYRQKQRSSSCLVYRFQQAVMLHTFLNPMARMDEVGHPHGGRGHAIR